jgi:uncharacterized protein
MSVLRQRLKRPETYIVVLAILMGLAWLDSSRTPPAQVTGRLYIHAVHLYQIIGRPLLKGHIQCRYRPTCSEYSIDAVRVWGIRRGLLLTVKRLHSCTTEVPMGTLDPVSPASSKGNAMHIQG